MKNKFVYKEKTFLVRIDKGWYQILNRLRADRQMSFKSLLEECLSECFGFDSQGKFGRQKHNAKT